MSVRAIWGRNDHGHFLKMAPTTLVKNPNCSHCHQATLCHEVHLRIDPAAVAPDLHADRCSFRVLPTRVTLLLVHPATAYTSPCPSKANVVLRVQGAPDTSALPRTTASVRWP